MYVETSKEIARQPSVWPLLAGIATSPIGLGVIGGLSALAIINHLTKDDDEDKEEKETVANSCEPLNEPLEMVYYEDDELFDEPYVNSSSTVSDPFNSTVQEPLNAESTAESSASKAVESDEPQYSKEDIEKEIIRRAMSEMGKRSGEARRRKKQLAMQS